MTDTIRRFTDTPPEIIERDGNRTISGYASVFYDGSPATEYQIGDNLYERIERTAFDRPLAEHQNTEVRYNHSEDFVLSTVDTGATVKRDDRGLRYSVVFDPADSDHTKVKSKIDKGIVKGSSFMASGVKYRFSEEGSKHVAYVTSVEKLIDVSIVNRPAYKGTSAMMRSEQLDADYADWLRRKAETDKRLHRT